VEVATLLASSEQQMTGANEQEDKHKQSQQKAAQNLLAFELH
jgi:hypothetical protein